MVKQILVRTLLCCLVSGSAPVFSQTIPTATPGLEERLLAVLTSAASQKEKSDACRQLGVVGSDKAVPVLAPLLADEKLSHMARYALETIPGPVVDKALRTALGKLKDLPLVGVIGSVGVRRDTQAVRPLTKLLHDANPEVRRAALRALGTLGTREAASALKMALSHRHVDKQGTLYEALLRCAEARSTRGDRATALELYAAFLEQEIPYQVRSAALRGTIVTHGSDNTERLAKCLRSSDYLTFAPAAQATLQLPGPMFTQLLADAIPHQTPDHQIVIIGILGQRADASALPTLHPLAQAGANDIRLSALAALTRIGHPSSVSLFVSLSSDANVEIAKMATASLASFPEDVETAVLGMLQSPQRSQRLLAIELIGQRHMTGSLPVLLQTALDADPGLRVPALKAIGELGSSEDITTLLALVPQITDTKVLNAMRQALVDICVRVSDPTLCVEQLVEALPRGTPAHKAALFRVLGSVAGPQALATVRAAVDDPHPDVHAGAIRVLSSWKDVEVAPVLLNLIRTTDSTRDRTICLRGYLSIAARRNLSNGQRLALCQELEPLLQNAGEKQQWLGVLGGIDSPKALGRMRPYFKDPAVKDKACMVAVTSIERLMKKNDNMKQNSTVTKTLQRVLAASSNAKLKERAQRLLDA